MPTGSDVHDDIFQVVMAESMEVHDALLSETSANGSHVHNVTRHFAAQKFNEVDPLEAAAAEVVLRITPLRTTNP